ILAAFGALGALSPHGDEVEDIGALRGLAFRRPLEATVLGLALLSLTGVPLTTGFVAKFYAFGAGVRADLWSLVLVGIVNSGISPFYYLRVLIALFTPESGVSAVPVEGPEPRWAATCLMVLALALVGLGIYPTPLARLAGLALDRPDAIKALARYPVP